ncbi:MAG: porin [Hydrogenovibrio sp.]|uniref:porin n=1 Tax=Hydrogenovibrio sp. TaxID=2065821 RepID=UPI00287091EC|nr:porin [Hydrogenovibrio sp.]MDR9498937.1 porin [Hydrogenovibrio sp.]
MKKNIVALAVASAIAAPVAMADAPTVYGKLNMAVEQFSVDQANGDKDKTASGTKINSIASRMGIKGSSDLGNGLKAVYKVEFGLAPDGNGKNSSNSDALTNRNQYLGLAGGFGTVLLGRHDTPLKMSQPKDFFNDGTADFKKMTGEMGAMNASGEIRASNVLAYVSPSFGGVKLVAALSPQEDGTNSNTDDESQITDFYSVAAMYGSKKEGLYLAAAMDKASDAYVGDRADGADQDATHVRVSAQYAMGGLIANAMYQDFSGDALSADNTNGNEGNTLTGGVAYKIGKFMPKLAVTQVNRDKADDGTKYEDSLNWAAGVNYSLGKKTTAYFDYSKIEHKGSNDFEDSKAEETAFSVGMIHKF